MKAPFRCVVLRDPNAGVVNLRFIGDDGDQRVIPMDDTKSLYEALHAIQGDLGDLVTEMVGVSIVAAKAPPEDTTP